MDLTEMQITTRLESTPFAARLYPLALRYHDFLKQEIKNLLDVEIIHKSMSSWAIHIIVVKSTSLRAPHNSLDCARITES